MLLKLGSWARFEGNFTSIAFLFLYIITALRRALISIRYLLFCLIEEYIDLEKIETGVW